MLHIVMCPLVYTWTSLISVFVRDIDTSGIFIVSIPVNLTIQQTRSFLYLLSPYDFVEWPPVPVRETV